MIKPWLVAVAALLLAGVPSFAEPQSRPSATWDIAAMNSQIDDTNVLVGAGGQDFCSGTVINIKKRLILTADHCVESQVVREQKEFVDPETGEITKKTIEKKLPLEISRRIMKNFEVVGSHRYLAVIKGRDPSGDVALLQVVDEGFVPTGEAKLAPDSYKLQRGQKVWIVGNPGIEFDNSITEGIVSATERTLEFPDRKMRVFQTDATAIGGNSGGSVLNAKGEMIGTLSAGLRSGNITFAAPIDITKRMLRGAGFSDVAGWPSKKADLGEGWGAPVRALKFVRQEGDYRFFIVPADTLTARFLGLF